MKIKKKNTIHIKSIFKNITQKQQNMKKNNQKNKIYRWFLYIMSNLNSFFKNSYNFIKVKIITNNLVKKF